MTIYLRQSTASQEIPLGYFVDSTDGNTAETALSIANTDIKVWKTGATTLADKNSGGATHISNGIYYCVLDATDTNTIGPLTVFVKVSGALGVKVDCCVLDETVYDVWFGTTAPATATNITAGTITTATNVTTVNGLAANVITAAATASDFGTEVGTAVWATAARTLTAATNITSTGGSVPITAGGLVSSDVTAISTDTTAANNAESFFDGTGYAGTNNVIPTVTSVTNGVTVSTNNDKTGYALSAAGVDAIWDEAMSGHQTTGTTGRALTLAGTILDETTATGTPTTTTLQLTAGSATDDFYNDLEIIPTTGTLAGQARIITDYAGATKTITIDEAWTSAPSNGDGVIIRARHSHSINQMQQVVDDALTAYGTATATDVTTAAANVSVDEIQATALADLFNTNSGTTYASAVAGSVVKEIADNAGGSSLTAADIADAVWDEAQAGHVTAGSFGEIATEIASILVDTAEIGVAGAGLTNINLPDQTMNITGNITGNLSGSVGSVTGAVGSVTGSVGGNVTGSVGSVATGGITAASFAAGAIDNAAIATDAIGSNELAASAIAEIQNGLSNLSQADIRTAVGLASANLDTQLAAIDDYLDTEVAAIKAKTDNLPASPAATGDIPSAGAIADAVWDESLSGHTTAGTGGATLTAAKNNAAVAAALSA
jgi:hypothetical protein